MDVLPYSKSIFNGNWLENDWYLNLTIPYRYFFSYPVGFFADTFGFIYTIIFGRLISYVLIALSLVLFIKSIKASQHSLLYYFSVILFFTIFSVGNGAGEWMVAALETKVFAYAFVLLSISSFLLKRHQLGLLFAGFALSFHLLIGIYNLFCLIPFFLTYQKKSKDYFIRLIRASPIFFLSGAVGIYGILYQFFLTEGNITNLGWEIYVNIRVPHHVLPSYFRIETWIKMAIFTLLNILFLIKTKNLKVKLLSSYALFSVIISLIGLAIFFVLGNSHHLKYYFFRYADIMLPFITLVNAVSIAIEKKNKTLLKRKNQIKTAVVIISLFCITPELMYIQDNATLSPQKMLESTVEDIAMIKWVKKNTSKNEVFITPPGASFFYINYERPMFVSWKHSPQGATDLEEWYKRLKLINRGNDFINIGQVYEGYFSLTEVEILAITEEYPDMGYFLTLNSIILDFPLLFKSSKYSLYQIKNI